MEALDNVPKKTKVVYESSSGIKNIVLEGVETLELDKVTVTWELTYETVNDSPTKLISKEKFSEKVEHLVFKLREITVPEYVRYKLSSIPSFAIKKDGKFYHTEIPADLNILASNNLADHRCATEEKLCARLNPLPYEYGGCELISDSSEEINFNDYPWITEVYETFNTDRDSYIVVVCEHYESFHHHSRVTYRKRRR